MLYGVRFGLVCLFIIDLFTDIRHAIRHAIIMSNKTPKGPMAELECTDFTFSPHTLENTITASVAHDKGNPGNASIFTTTTMHAYQAEVTLHGMLLLTGRDIYNK